MAQVPDRISPTRLTVDIEKAEIEAPRFDVFDVSWAYSLPLPEGGFFSKWIDRMEGEQCVQIIDANDNHRPDDGDTCVGRNGDLFPDAKFVGDPLVTSYAGKTCSNLTQFKAFSETADACAMSYRKGDEVLFGQDAGVTFDVHRPGGAERLSTELANGGQDYGMRVKGQAIAAAEATFGSVEEHPIAAGGAVAVVGGLLAHPYTRLPTLAVLEWLGIGGAAVGTGYVVYDRADAFAQYAEDGDADALQQNMGNHDVEAGLAMLGGVQPGLSVSQAASKFWTGPTRAFDFTAGLVQKAAQSTFGSQGFSGFAFAAAGADGGAFAIDAPLVMEAGALSSTGATLPSAPLGPIVLPRLAAQEAGGAEDVAAIKSPKPLEQKLQEAPPLKNQKLERDLSNPRFVDLSDQPATLDYFLRNPEDLLGFVPEEGDEVILIFAMDHTGEIRVGVSSPFVVHHSSLFGPTVELRAAGEMNVVFQRTAWGRLVGHVKKVDAMSGHFLPNPETTLPLVEDVLQGWRTPLAPDFSVDTAIYL